MEDILFSISGDTFEIGFDFDDLEDSYEHYKTSRSIYQSFSGRLSLFANDTAVLDKWKTGLAWLEWFLLNEDKLTEHVFERNLTACYRKMRNEQRHGHIFLFGYDEVPHVCFQGKDGGIEVSWLGGCEIVDKKEFYASIRKIGSMILDVLVRKYPALAQEDEMQYLKSLI